MCTKNKLKGALLMIAAINGALALATLIVGLVVAFELNIQRAFGAFGMGFGLRLGPCNGQGFKWWGEGYVGFHWVAHCLMTKFRNIYIS
jgi:hypothetical protein